MDNFNPMMTADLAERMERMYPDAASMLMPHTREMADSLSEEALNSLTHADVARMADEAVMRSGPNLPMGHSAQTMGDMARALVIRDIVARGRRFGGRFPLFPFFFFPWDGWFDGRRFGFDGRRDGFDGRRDGFDGRRDGFDGGFRDGRRYL